MIMASGNKRDIAACTIIRFDGCGSFVVVVFFSDVSYFDPRWDKPGIPLGIARILPGIFIMVSHFSVLFFPFRCAEFQAFIFMHLWRFDVASWLSWRWRTHAGWFCMKSHTCFVTRCSTRTHKAIDSSRTQHRTQNTEHRRKEHGKSHSSQHERNNTSQRDCDNCGSCVNCHCGALHQRCVLLPKEGSWKIGERRKPNRCRRCKRTVRTWTCT